MKHFVVDTSTQVENLRKLANCIGRTANPFDMDDPTICALGNARKLGLLKASRTQIHMRGCGCPRCTDYYKLAAVTGIGVPEWESIFQRFRFGNDRKVAAKFFRTRAKELESA